MNNTELTVPPEDTSQALRRVSQVESQLIRLRDAARSLAEETQHIRDSKIRMRTIKLAQVIEDSDRLIPPEGLQTTLLSASVIHNL